MAHPYFSEEDVLAREKKKPGQWWSSVQTGWWREEAIKLSEKSMSMVLSGNLDAPHRLATVQDFQRKWTTRLDSRVRFDRVESVSATHDCLMSEFALCVWRHLRADSDDVQLRWTYRHYGSWTNNSYNLILYAQITSFELARIIFGVSTLSPRSWFDAGEYNSNPARGDVRGGRLHVVVSKESPLSLSVREFFLLPFCFVSLAFVQFNFRTQELRVSFVYKKTRWVQEDYTRAYEVDNGIQVANPLQLRPAIAATAPVSDEKVPNINYILSDLQDLLAHSAV